MKLYTVKEIMESFGVSRTTVNNWRKKGLIKDGDMKLESST